jgi:nucleoside-diphosphate-sugar epimerase
VRVLVTGGHGFVGSHLVDVLLARGDRVRCLHRRARTPRALEGKDVEVVRADVRNAAGLEAAFEGVEEVHHLAALTRSSTRREMIETNTGGTVRLLRAAERAGFRGRFVLCSSLAAVGPSADGRPLTGDETPNPLTWYGESKMLAERAARAVRAFPVTIVRPPAVYGPGDRDFLPLFRAAARGWIPQLGTTPVTCSLVHAPDVAEGILAAARSSATAGGAFFVTHPDAVSVTALGAAVLSAVGRSAGRRLRLPRSTLLLLGRGGDIVAQLSGRPGVLNRDRLAEMSGPHWVCSAEPLAEATGWRARTPLEQGLARTAAWYREQGLLAPVR